MINQNVFYQLLLNKYLNIFSYKTPSYLDIFRIVVGVSGYILTVGGWCWVVVDMLWLVVGGGGYILAAGGGGGWWWVVA